MNRVYLFVYAFIVFMAAICIILLFLLSKEDKTLPIKTGYVIYPSEEKEGKWNIVFPQTDDLYVNLKPEQIAMFLKSGEIPEDTTWVVYPQCEYQLTVDEEHIIVKDFGRPVTKLFYSETGKLADILIKDNE